MKQISTSPTKELGCIVEDLSQNLGLDHGMQMAVAVDDARVAETDKVRHHWVDLHRVGKVNGAPRNEPGC